MMAEKAGGTRSDLPARQFKRVAIENLNAAEAVLRDGPTQLQLTRRAVIRLSQITSLPFQQGEPPSFRLASRDR
jgi:hypothetical protein